MLNSNSTVIQGLDLSAFSAVREDFESPIRELPYITSAVLHLPLEIYHLLATAVGGVPNLMNALLPSFVEVQINDGTTSMYYRGHLSDILPSQNLSPDAIFDDRSSPQDARVTSEFHENTHPPCQVPSTMYWEHATNHDTGSSFEVALGVLNGQATSNVHHTTLPLELPLTIQPILPLISSSTAAAFPFSAPSSFVDGRATLFKIPFADRQVSHQSEDKIQSARGHQVQQPGCPRTYMVDGLSIDEEDLIDGNTNNGLINVHACDREDHPCGLWVKADRRSIIRHGQRWHEDDRFGVDRMITCPWLGCNRQMRASGVPRHTLSAHFGVTWICKGPGCSKVFGRHDTFKAHAAKRGCLGATVKYDANTRVVNAKNVLSHYG